MTKNIINISEQELNQTLKTYDYSPEIVTRYFNVIQPNTFTFDYSLKRNITMTGNKNPFINIANYIFKHRRQRLYRQTLERFPHREKIVSEGDSWFQHALEVDVIDHLFNHYAIFSLGAAGDDLSKIFEKNEYTKAIEKENPKIFLFSAGGNDILGNNFKDYILEYSQGTPGFNPERFLKKEIFYKLDDIKELYYSMLKKIVWDFPRLKIIIHGYDYILPGKFGRQARFIGKHLIRKGITDEKDKNEIIRLLIDRFNENLQTVSREFRNVVFLDLRNTVRPEQWRDEIHPDCYGFQNIALKFQGVIERL